MMIGAAARASLTRDRSVQGRKSRPSRMQTRKLGVLKSDPKRDGRPTHVAEVR